MLHSWLLFKFAFGGFLLAALMGCTTPRHKAVKSLRLGMEKPDVLQIMGDPERTGKKHNVEYWTYKYRQKGKRAGTSVFFKYGEVIAIKPTSPKPSLKKQLNQAETKWEYETLLKAHRAQKDKKPPVEQKNDSSSNNKE